MLCVITLGAVLASFKGGTHFFVLHTCPLNLYIGNGKLGFPSQQSLWVFNTAVKSSSAVLTLCFKFPSFLGWPDNGISAFARPGFAMFYCTTSSSSSSRFYGSNVSVTAVELSWTKANTPGTYTNSDDPDYIISTCENVVMWAEMDITYNL
jgi:hypothetical protein